MYDETSFKNYIFWLQVRRVFLIILFSIIGCALGVVFSQFLVDVLLFETSKVLIIIISTIIFFAMSLLITVGTSKEIQEGYWKMAVLRKLTVISKKLDYLENLNISSQTNSKKVENNIPISSMSKEKVTSPTTTSNKIENIASSKVVETESTENEN